MHPAPSAAKALRYTYYAKPVTATDSVSPDWPTSFRYLLHRLLRLEMGTKGAKGGQIALNDAAFVHEVDAAYNRASQEPSVIPISMGRTGRVTVEDLKSRVNIL